MAFKPLAMSGVFHFRTREVKPHRPVLPVPSHASWLSYLLPVGEFIQQHS